MRWYLGAVHPSGGRGGGGGRRPGPAGGPLRPKPAAPSPGDVGDLLFVERGGGDLLRPGIAGDLLFVDRGGGDLLRERPPGAAALEAGGGDLLMLRAVVSVWPFHWRLWRSSECASAAAIADSPLSIDFLLRSIDLFLV